MVFPVIGGNQSTGDFITNSLRFNDDDDPYLLRTPSSTGDQRTFTFSVWLKQAFGQPSGNHVIFSAGSDGSNFDQLRIKSNSFLQFESEVSSSVKSSVYTTHFFRDPTAWYHLVLRVDTTQSTAANRVRFYKDGTLLAIESGSQPDQNQQLNTNTQIGHGVGTLWRGSNSGNEWDGYMANAHFADGQSYAPTQFGETNDNGVWVPKEFAGSFGTNGFKLEFKQTGTSANAAGIGADTGSNGHHHSLNGLAATDVTTDTPQNNFATFNPLIASLTASGNATVPTYSEGNCKTVTTNSGKAGGSSTIQISSGKWYAEFEYDATNKSDPSSGVCSVIGVTDSPQLNARSFGKVGERANDVAFTDKGTKMINDSLTSYGNAYSTGNIIGVAVDLDNNKIYFSINGTFQNSGDPTSGATGTGAIALTAPASTVEGGYYFAVGDSHTETSTHLANFGAAYPASISSGNSDANGHGNFEYAVPSGYFALCTKNLAEHG